MKDDIRRVMKLVQEGKLSPDDAVELIDAFSEAPEYEAPSQEAPTDSAEDEPGRDGEGQAEDKHDTLSNFFDAIERISKDVAKNVNWSDIAKQVKQGVQSGVDAVKSAAEEARKGRGINLFGQVETKTLELPLEIGEGKILRIEGASGDVLIKGGAEKPSLSLVATFRGFSREEAKQKADSFMPVIESGDQFVLLRQPDGVDATVDVEALIPAETPVEIRSLSGDVVVKGVRGGLKIQGHSGDISIEDVAGVLEINVASGDISVVRAESSLCSIEAKSGDLHLKQVSGALTLRSATGDVNLEACKPRTLSIEVATGDVCADFVEPISGVVNVRTVSGDCKLLVPDGSDCRVHLATLRGDVKCGLELLDEVREAQSVAGRLGDGEGTLDVSTVKGDISLDLRDHGSC